jgi:Uma2 family endonuclease
MMSPEVTTPPIEPIVAEAIATPVDELPVDWEPPLPPTDLIFDDGEPLESNRHRVAMNVLIRSAKEALRDRTDFFCGGNMFIYYSSRQVRNRDFRGPDFFVVLGVDPDLSRQGWVVWEENGRYPDVIIELLSPSTAQVDLNAKKILYQEVFHTRDYYVFDPYNPNSLQGWHLNLDSGYQLIPENDRGWLWCQSLGLWVGTWNGAIEDDTTTWLRFYDESGNPILLPEEAASQQAEAERQRAEAASLQAEAERQRAEAASQQAEAERQRAEAASQQAEAERQRAEAASQQAEAERQRAERLATRLRELGEAIDLV